MNKIHILWIQIADYLGMVYLIYRHQLQLAGSMLIIEHRNDPFEIETTLKDFHKTFSY